MFFSAGVSHITAETTVEINLQEYFDGVNGTAIFYYPEADTYVVYQRELSEKRSSPCSTFKIFSTYVGLDMGVIQMNDSVGTGMSRGIAILGCPMLFGNPVSDITGRS